jgi:phosphoribosyl 1,2-cyclic phosphodiesterase
MKTHMIAKFWGVRGSIPAPATADEIKRKIVQALRRASGHDLGPEGAVRQYVEGLPHHIAGTYGGNTPCVELQAGDHTIIFDAGSGIRGLGMSLMARQFGKGHGIAHVFFSHTHWDHIQGFPFFQPAYKRGNRIVVYSPLPDMEERLIGQQDPTYFPVPLDAMEADIQCVLFPEGKKIVVGDLHIKNIKLNHPGGSFAYRVEGKDTAFVYATDTEFTNLTESEKEKYIGFFSGAKALVFDSQYTLVEAVQKEDWGHSPSLKGVDLAREAGVETLILFHHEPAYDDQALQDILKGTRKYATLQGIGHTLNVIMAYEGLELAF